MTDDSQALTASHVQPGARGLTRFAQVVVVALAAWLVVLGLFNLLHPSDWAMGDWLINYSGGFVRRGLIGQIASLLRFLHIPPLWTVLLVQWALYAVMLYAVWRLAGSVRWNWWTAAFFFSPATLAFVLLDPPFAFRKDILFLALLALALGLVTNGHPSTTKSSALASVLLLTVGCAVCLLAHEGLIVFFPYLFAALYLRCRDLRQTAVEFATPAAIAVALFAIVSHFPGNAQVAQAVCTSLGGTITTPPSGICGGAIDYLAHDATYAHHEVVRVTLAGQYWKRIPWLFLLPLLPAALGFHQLWRTDRSAARVLLATFAVAWLLSISLFYYGTDWTRWIYIHSFSVMMLMLFTQRRGLQSSNEETSKLFQSKKSERWMAWGLLLMYCFGWELTVYGQRPLYGSFVRFVTHNMARGQQ